MAKTKTSNIRIATLPTIPYIDVSTFSDEVLARDSFTGAVYTDVGRLGNGTHYVNIDASAMKSANFVAGSAGWRIQYDGSVEFSSGIFRGDISAATGTFTAGIAIGTSPTWFKVDTVGNLWSGAATLATAPFSVTNAGALIATSATITGVLTAGAGSVINGTYLTAGTVTSAKTKIAIRGWSNDIVFSATDGSTVAWAAGTVALSDGETTYDITASNTGTMSALNYIYLDVDTSTTAFQVSDVSGSAIGDNKILVAVAQNIGDENKYAKFQVFGGGGGVGVLLTTVNLAANCVTANLVGTNEIIANTANIANAVITDAKITGTITVTHTDAKCTDANADQTSANTAADTTAVGGLASSTVAGWQYGATTTIDGGDIQTGTITALGTVTAGAFVCSTSGYVRGGQTAYNTGTGFWLGYDTDTYKFSIGVPTGNHLTWDGSALTIGGTIDHQAGDVLYQSADTERNTGTTLAKKKEITVYRGGTYRIKFDIKAEVGDAGATGQIYKNGSPEGTLRTVTESGSFTNFSEDVSGWVSEDLIQLYIQGTDQGCYCRNFRLYVSDYDSSDVDLD